MENEDIVKVFNHSTDFIFNSAKHLNC